MNVYRLCALALATLASACSPYAIRAPVTPPVDPHVPVPAGLAEVCVVRPGSFGLWATQVVRDNGALAGATRGRRWFCYRALPGSHRVTSRVGTSEAATQIELQAGQRVFLEQEAQMAGIVLQRLREDVALREIAGLQYAELVETPRDERPPLPGAVVVGASSEPPPPPSAPAPRPRPRRRPEGYALSLSGGLGAGIGRDAVLGIGAPADKGFAAAGTYSTSITDGDFFQLGASIDALEVAGHGVMGASLRTAFFPGAWRPGPVADFNVFLELGAGGRLGAVPSGVMGKGLFLGTLGVGWEGWRTGSLAAGPFLAGKIGHGDANMALVLLGLEATLYTGER